FSALVAEKGASERQSPKDPTRAQDAERRRAQDAQRRRAPVASEDLRALAAPTAPVAHREAPAASPGVNRLPPSASRSYGASRPPGSASRFTRRQPPSSEPALREAPAASPERQPLLPSPAAAPGASRLPQAPDARHHGVSEQDPGAGRRNTCRLHGDSLGHHRHSQGGEVQEPGKQGEPGAPFPQGKQIPEQGPQGRPASASAPRRGTDPLEKTDATAACTLQAKRPKADAPTDRRPEPDPRREPQDDPGHLGCA
ncbi:PREDICTED: uncharacterized protein LOC105564518, partial [Vollenhovia emeryi]|uniref:uncharacterized protein LOC105564518 n=1 Tax=Vollenhovia emeryi TaxID=411798 RepID=UPI0005F44992